MKTKYIIFLFAMSFFSVPVSAQNGSNDWYPLAIGNYWEYVSQNIDDPLSVVVYSAKKVISEIVAPNNKHYFIIESYNRDSAHTGRSLSYYRYENNKLYEYFPVQVSEYVRTNFDSADHAAIPASLEKMEYVTRGFFGKDYMCCKFKSWGIYFPATYAKGLGFMEDSYSKMTGAIINGIKYGSISTIDNIPTGCDLFPLSQGSVFRYKLFESSSFAGDVGTESNYLKTTEGIANIKIVSAIISSDTIKWNIEETDSLRYLEYHGTVVTPVIDSIYTKKIQYRAFEALADSHNISLPDYSKIWNIPTQFHRYAGKENLYNQTVSNSDDLGSWNDTLVFNTGVGLTYHYSSSGRGQTSYSQDVFSAKLIDFYPVKVQAEINPNAKKIFLEQNYPNPFNPNTTIKYSIPNAGIVSVKVFDVLGKEVAELVNEIKSAGSYSVDFNASNLPSGVYFYCLKSGGFVESKKLILIK